MSKIYILLPVHNRKDVTRRFIDCLQAQSFTDYHLVLIDDGSTDGSSEMVHELMPSATVLCGTGDWWWAGSLQAGIDWLHARFIDDSALVMFANDDVSFGPDYLAAAFDIIKVNANALLLSKFSFDNGLTLEETGIVADLKRLAFRTAYPKEKINCLSTRGLFARWDVLKSIGGFHPRFLPHYLSDYEFTIRAASRGVDCITDDHVWLCPNLQNTPGIDFSNQSVASYLRYFYSKKNPDNPIFWSTFVILTGSPLWVLPNLIKIWCRAIANCSIKILSSL